jgi:MFS family permease
VPALNPLILVCIAKAIRTFGFGAISVILAIYLIQKGFSTALVGAIFSATLIEDAVVTTLVSMLATRLGMRRVLLCASTLVILCGLLLAGSDLPWVIVCASVFGIVSPAGYEGGPFGPIEQTIISASEPAKNLTRAFSWYNLVGFGGAALGALFAGAAEHFARTSHFEFLYQTMFLAYAVGGLVLFCLYLIIEIPDLHASLEQEFAARAAKIKLHKSRRSVFKLSALQGLDAFGGGFVAQSLIAYWFYIRFQAGPEFTGPIFFWANVLAAISFTAAPLFVKRFGLLRTLVFTHLPCSLALCLIPLMPSAAAAGFILLGRSLFSSMDIPVRQAYAMLLVAPDERPAAAGIINAARAACQGVAPLFSGLVLTGTSAVFGIPFICAGLTKSIYDVGMYATFRHVKLDAEEAVPLRLPLPPDDAAAGSGNHEEDLVAVQ